MALNRREAIIAATGIGVATVGGIMTLTAQTRKPNPQAGNTAAQPKSSERDISEEPNSPPEYIMLEHGVIDRLLLIYDECARRLRANEALPINVLYEAANTIHKFGEEYHEKREDKVLAPFVAHADYAAVVKTLKAQHEVGHGLTAKILANASAEKIANSETRKILIDACESYSRMLRPHMAREATELLQAIYEIISVPALDALSMDLMRDEMRVFGEDGFDKTVEQIANLEKQLGIHDLERFLPRA